MNTFPEKSTRRATAVLIALFTSMAPLYSASARTTGTTTPTAVKAQHGVVAADHPLASRAGVEMLEAGGNAVDAACATMFALGVVNPTGSGLGGGGFMLIALANGAEPAALDFRETAPQRATREMFVGTKKSARRASGLAVGVPGEVQGCAEAIERYGRLDLRRVLAPAIALAIKGFATGPYLAMQLRAHDEELLQHHPSLRELFVVGGDLLGTGAWQQRPGLGRSLTAIAEGGTNIFYRGWIAREIVATVKQAGGIMELHDLAHYRVVWRRPLHATLAGNDVVLMPLPSSGGIAMIEALNLLHGVDLHRLGHNSVRYIHLLTEAMKHAFADRARWLGDSDYVKVPIRSLISARRAAHTAARLGERVHSSQTYGLLPANGNGVVDDHGTTHLSVIDRWGNAVALTTSINNAFGSLLVAGPRSGIILNDTMDDFTTRPGKPNLLGLRQGAANEIAPGKRPLSSMSPTIVRRHGRVIAALGGSGGPTIISATLQVLLNVLVFQMDAAAAVGAGRLHHQWMPNTLWLEPEIAGRLTEPLRALGHKVGLIRRPPKPYTAVQIVLRDRDQLVGASDPRKQGAPAGY